ncbi:hypothetical protein D3C80_764770 [compost metagenome]
MVDTTSANNGDKVSLTPRSNCVNSTNTNSDGMIHNITWAYATASSSTSAGVPNPTSADRANTLPTTAATNPINTPNNNVAPAIAFTRCVSRAPHACPINTPAPAPRPITRAMKKNTMGNIPDTAARAWVPSIWPM